MRAIIYLLGILVLLSSCNRSAKNSENQLPVNSDIAPVRDVAVESKRDSSPTKLLEVNEEFYFSAIKSAKDTISDFDTYKTREFTRQKEGQTHFKYYLLKELKFGNNFRSYLIAEDYESEQACWLANFDTNGNIISVCEVYYNNAEGAWTTNSLISESEKMIQINTYDAYSDPEESSAILKINDIGKFVE